MCAVDSCHFADDRSCLDQGIGELAEDVQVGVLAESVSELDEEAVAGCLSPESAGSGYFSIVHKPEGQSSVTYDA